MTKEKITCKECNSENIRVTRENNEIVKLECLDCGNREVLLRMRKNKVKKLEIFFKCRVLGSPEFKSFIFKNTTISKLDAINMIISYCVKKGYDLLSIDRIEKTENYKDKDLVE